MNMPGYEATVKAMRERNIPEEKIQKFAREQWPEVAAQLDAAAVKVEARREKDAEHAGDQLMQAHGFTVIRFSQPRQTKQTPGIPDRRYYKPPVIEATLTTTNGGKFKVPGIARAVWFEAKTSTGKQSPAQREFQQLVESCGETYLVGTDAVLRDYLSREGLLRD